ncbi:MULTISPECIES: tyrosine-type recombinase/integrase [unclassified Bradyrhizobium]|uniref:tyrosine-type recombinase/integrase n=1 Tax=unclassified Bradyrhizobium TaxID=2631580 RepID=UPI002916B8BD|nr:MULTISPECIES: tyrosine-type recombinase/integrase [unclassified Bradyrhizobium]
MPRKSKGPRLELKRYRDRPARWVIRDGQQTLGTGCDERDRDGAERKLGAYILKKHDPAKAIRQGDPNQAKIADIMSLEMQHIAKSDITDVRKKQLISLCERIGNWFGDRVVGDLNGELQERYAAERIFQPSAWRELKILAAAVNRYLKRNVGGVQVKFTPTLPDAPQPRERWLTRQEAAKLIRAAWRLHHEGFNGGKVYTSRHVARFILVGLYTGSRAGDICGAALTPSLHRGFVDLERGIFRRKPAGKIETSKRQPTTPLPPRLLAHMRRWQRLGISKHSVIEYNGRSIHRLRKGWDTAVKEAGLATDNPKMRVVRHTLRHTSISWYLASGTDIELVSQFTGVSVATIRKVYRHALPGTFDPVLDASHRFGR